LNWRIIDETGDRKKGNKTDYVKRQYIGNLGKIENGIVAVTAYGVICNKRNDISLIK
jgi:SRSO17 transposase